MATKQVVTELLQLARRPIPRYFAIDWYAMASVLKRTRIFPPTRVPISVCSQQGNKHMDVQILLAVNGHPALALRRFWKRQY